MNCPLCNQAMITNAVLPQGEYKFRCYDCQLTHNKLSIPFILSNISLDKMAKAAGLGGSLFGAEQLEPIVKDMAKDQLLEYYHFNDKIILPEEWERRLKLKSFW